MTLAETYANHCGVKIGPPILLPSLYFPTPVKYITIHNGSGMQSKNYDYFQEVVNSIGPILLQQGIGIVQIGLDGEPRLLGCFHLNGQTNLYQCAYVVEHALLHIGNDSIWTHYAGAAGVPCVGLYGPTLANVCRPYHHGKFVGIESDRKGNRPTHSNVENPKTINYIKPEEVSNAALSMMEFPDRIQRESIFFGRAYRNYVLEYIPDFLIQSPIADGIIVNIRMDKCFNENMLANILNLHNNKVDIFTERPISINLLNHFKGRINCIYYKLSKTGEVNSQFAADLHTISLNYGLITDEEDTEQISRWRFEFFDYKIIYVLPKKTKSFIENAAKLVKTTFVKTHRQILSNGKSYHSFAHWRDDKPSENNQNTTEIGAYLDDDLFWEDLDFFYLYN